MKRSYTLLLIAILALTLSFTQNGLQKLSRALAQDTAAPLQAWSDADSAQLDQFIPDMMQTLNIPGTAIGIIQNGQVVYTRGFGVQEVGSSEPITPDTLFMIGSVTKSMTSMMMATMVDDGSIGWDTRTRAIVPEFALSDPGRADTLTLRQMVCNCAGVLQQDPVMVFRSDSVELPDVVQMLAQFPVSGPVGASFNYSNQTFALGGYAAAIAATNGSLETANSDYANQIEQRVWEPIGMSHTTLNFDEATASGDVAAPHGYSLDASFEPIPLQVEHFVVPIAPAAAAWSSVNDMVRYVITQSQEGVAPDGQQVVSADSLSATWQPQVQIMPGQDYALGWGVVPLGDGRILSHNGGTIGFTSNVTVVPESDFGYVILVNAGNVDAYLATIQRTILSRMFGLNLEVTPKVDEQLSRQPVLPTGLSDTVNESAVTPFIGRYTDPTFGDIELRLDQGQLRFSSSALDSALYPHQTTGGLVDVYYGYSAPLTGSTFQLRTDPSGAPVIQMHYLSEDVPEGYVDITFTRLD